MIVLIMIVIMLKIMVIIMVILIHKQYQLMYRLISELGPEPTVLLRPKAQVGLCTGVFIFENFWYFFRRILVILATVCCPVILSFYSIIYNVLFFSYNFLKIS